MPLIPHELHLTLAKRIDVPPDRFAAAAASIGGKAILIELPQGARRSQPMVTKVVHVAGVDDAKVAADKCKDELCVALGLEGPPHPPTRRSGLRKIAAALGWTLHKPEPLAADALWRRRFQMFDRTKIEIPADHAPDRTVLGAHGPTTYFEWHGKVAYERPDELLAVCLAHGAHLSHNALRNDLLTRFVTVRDYGRKAQFLARVERLAGALTAGGWPLSKSQHEYCVYDSSVDSDIGWLGPSSSTIELTAQEAFIRRAARIDAPFVLKGSHVGRHYFADPTLRKPGDMDWLCLGNFATADEAHRTFHAWAEAVTTTDIGDGVEFTPFALNAFWRNVEYSLADDFPTTTTDLTAVVDGHKAELSFDLSFNLPLRQPPVPLCYQPSRGEPFTVTKTVPLSIQIAWKLHQTVVRARMKDIYDLWHFVRHPAFTDVARDAAIESYVADCAIVKAPPNRLSLLTSGNWHPLFNRSELDPRDRRNTVASRLDADWSGWRHGGPPDVPETLAAFQSAVVEAFAVSGLAAAAARLD
jgi:hypothetical protein